MIRGCLGQSFLNQRIFLLTSVRRLTIRTRAAWVYQSRWEDCISRLPKPVTGDDDGCRIARIAASGDQDLSAY